MTPEQFMENFGAIAEAPGGIKQLRRLILDMATRGRLSDREWHLHSLPLGDVITFRQNLIHPGDGTDENVIFVGPEHIERDTGRRIGGENMHSSGLRGRKFRFSPGEIVYTYLRPYLNKVWIADIEGVCSVDQYVLQVDPALAATRYIQLIMLGPSFLRVTEDLTHNLQLPRLRSGLLNSIEISLPLLAEQKRIVAKVDQLMAMLDDLEQRQEKKRSAAIHVSQACLDSLVNAEDPDQLAHAWERVSKNFDVMIGQDTIRFLHESVKSMALQGRFSLHLHNDQGTPELLDMVERERKSLRVADKGLLPLAESDVPYTSPRTWRWVRLGSLLLGSDAGKSPQCEQRPREAREWGVLKVSAVSWGQFRPEENKALPPDVPPFRASEVQNSNFLISRANTEDLVARSVVVTKTPTGLLLSDKIIRLHFSSHVNPHFFNLYNNSHWAHESIIYVMHQAQAPR